MASSSLLRLSSGRPHAGARDTSQLPPSHAPAKSTLASFTRPRPEANDNDILDRKRAPFALLVLRVALGAMFLQHVMAIVFGYEPADVSKLFGLPAGVSPYALGWDTLIGLALLYGLWGRLAAIAGAATLSVAMIQAHSATAISPFGWQLPVFWIAALLAYALAGDGAYPLVPSPVFRK
ncbi:MAG TPA: DoxX family protein [Rhizomicrobium sp.]|nr:DoxX family protein [Rhizomicrobium sp.]